MGWVRRRRTSKQGTRRTIRTREGPEVGSGFFEEGGLVVFEEGFEEGFAIVEEAAGDLPGVGLVEGDLVDAAAVEGEDLGSGVAEQDGGVGGDDELSVLVVAQGVVDEDEEGELALGGEGGFGFVEEEEAGAAELMVEDGEEGLAVGAVVEGDAAVCIEDGWARAAFRVECVKVARDSCRGFRRESRSLHRCAWAGSRAGGRGLVGSVAAVRIRLHSLVKLRLPPSRPRGRMLGGDATSSRVDLPVPFSPAKRVTRAVSLRWVREAMAGTENG